MTQATLSKPVEVKTCAACPYFNNFHEPSGRGWCELFNHQAKKHHEITNDCILSSDLAISHELEDNLDIFSNVNLDQLDAFPNEELKDELNEPLSEYEVGSIVKVIDKDKYHTKWSVFEIIECMCNKNLYNSIETYLHQSEWYYRTAINSNE